ncbi:MAG TPA: exosortase/archaeosortase family protein [Phycisphaerales bacterium]|nr:exosortase/archaeosortase family protein [Phycisphaerales bacterium]
MTTAPASSTRPGEVLPPETARAGTGTCARYGLGALGVGAWVTIALLAASVIVLYWPWLVRQNFFCVERSADWGHAYVVPLISGYLVWQRRRELLALRPATFWPGAVVLATGIACYVFFCVGFYNHMAQGWSLVLTVFGLVLFLLGPAYLPWLTLPVAFLLLGITISDMVMTRITAPMQLIASKGAYILLNLIGVNTLLAGNRLDIIPGGGGATIPLQVAEACAGMRTLIAFVALGAAVALLSTRVWWQRVAVLMLAVPVALLMNTLRVVALGLVSLADPDLAGGEAHTLIGTLTLIPGFFLFMACVWVLKRGTAPREPAASPASPCAALPAPALSWRPRPAVLVALAALIGSAGAFGAARAQMGIRLRKKPIEAPGGRQVHAVPAVLPSWERLGDDGRMSAEEMHELGTDNFLTRVYRAKRPMPGFGPALEVQVHLAYETGMIEAVPHVPERCMVGHGWAIGPEGSRRVPIPLETSRWRAAGVGPAGPEYVTSLDRLTSDAPGSQQRITFDPGAIQMQVTHFVNSETGAASYAGYFFIANGLTCATAEQVRSLAFDLRADYAYFLKVQFHSRQARSHEELARAAGLLLDELLPELARCVPDWAEVRRGTYPVPETGQGQAGAP